MANSNITNKERLAQYSVPTDLEDRFYNIMNFAKNMTLKNSREYYDAENDISKYFSKMLIKYFSTGLSNNEILQLIQEVEEYNESIEAILKQRLDEETDNLKKSKFRLSLYGINAEKLTDDDIKPVSINYEKIRLLDGYNNSLIHLFIEKNKNNIKKSDGSLLNDNDILLNLENNIINFILTKRYFTDDGIYTPIFDTLLQGDEENPYIISNSSKLKDVETALITSKYIFIKPKKIKNNKNSASTEERMIAESGEHLAYFDISLYAQSNTEMQNFGYFNKYLDTEDSNNIYGTTYTYGGAIILYKEFNSKYRELLFSDICELAFFSEKTDIEQKMDVSEKNSITKQFCAIPRNNTTLDIFFKYSGDETSTKDLYKYSYVNPYTARIASESEMIRYFKGDNYISHGYGKYSYENEEINNFIDIFKEVRYYYYKVLLNESFINEQHYNLYEKTILIFMAVVRFMALKLDELKNIDTYNRKDIENFLYSFGMGKLADILNLDSNFANAEIYSKKILKNYLNLVQNKGSKDVIDILEDVFSIGSTELKIYKNILIGYKENDKKKYYFIKLDYNTNDILKEIENSTSRTPLSDYVNSDIYWDADDTPDAELNNLGLDVANTKYISPEVSIELSESTETNRLIFALIDALSEKFGSGNNNGNILINNIPLDKCLDAIRSLWKRYLKIITGKEGYNTTTPGNSIYRLNTNVIKENGSSKYNIYKYFNKNKSDGNLEGEMKRENEPYHYRDYETKNQILKKLIKFVNLYNSKNLDADSLKDAINDFNDAIKDFKKITRLSSGDISASCYNFLNEFFSELLTIKKDDSNKDFIEPVDDTINVEDVYTSLFSNETLDMEDQNSIKNAIINLCDNVSTVLEISLSISLTNRDETFIKFLKFSIEYFISYTADVYDFSFRHSYNSPDESLAPHDETKLDITMTDIDSFFYDELLKITVEEQNEGGN